MKMYMVLSDRYDFHMFVQHFVRDSCIIVVHLVCI